MDFWGKKSKKCRGCVGNGPKWFKTYFKNILDHSRQIPDTFWTFYLKNPFLGGLRTWVEPIGSPYWLSKWGTALGPRRGGITMKSVQNYLKRLYMYHIGRKTQLFQAFWHFWTPRVPPLSIREVLPKELTNLLCRYFRFCLAWLNLLIVYLSKTLNLNIYWDTWVQNRVSRPTKSFWLITISFFTV